MRYEKAPNSKRRPGPDYATCIAIWPKIGVAMAETRRAEKSSLQTAISAMEDPVFAQENLPQSLQLLLQTDFPCLQESF